MRGFLAGSLILVIAYVAHAVDGGNAPAAPTGHEFKIEDRSGRTFNGRFSRSIPMKTEYGKYEIEAGQIRRITLAPPGEQAADVIELKDRSHVRGKLELEVIEVAEGEPLKLVDIREFKAVGTGTVSLTTILLGLLTLTAMEIVLGIDNIIFLAILAGKLPKEQQPRARKLGLTAALGTRLLLLATLSFLLGLTKPLFTLPNLPFLHDLDAREISLRDLILLLGGMFLIGKSVMEMHEKLEEAHKPANAKPLKPASFVKVLVQIAIIDIVFSLDSVITAVGMVEELWVMITAMILAMGVMMLFAGAISDFVSKHPTLKVLALSFLILIGVMLVAESLGQHMDKGYIYFAMAFAVIVEMINLKLTRKPDHEPKPAMTD